MPRPIQFALVPLTLLLATACASPPAPATPPPTPPAEQPLPAEQQMPTEPTIEMTIEPMESEDLGPPGEPANPTARPACAERQPHENC